MGSSPVVPGRPATTPQRGDIYWIEIEESQTSGSEQHGCRPWLIVSLDSINARFPIVVAVPLTTQFHKIEGARQFRIMIFETQKIQEPGHPKGCRGDSLALTEQIRVLSTDRLPSQRAARLAPKAIDGVEAGIAFVLDIG
jgi:mRNA-degrading endonuclease toxin of MazEF toxin-antitoxin module